MQIILNQKHLSSELYIIDNSANIVVSFEFLDVHPTGYDIVLFFAVTNSSRCILFQSVTMSSR